MAKFSYPGISFNCSRIDYFFVFMCVIFLGGATVFTNGSLEQFGLSVDAGIEAIIGKIFMIILSIILLNKHNISIYKCFNLKLISVILLWGILQFIKYKQFSTYPIVRIFNLYFALVLIYCYREKLIYFLEDIIAKLALLDFILWVIMLIMPELMDFIMSLSPIENHALADGNSWVVFAQAHQYEIVRRNIGFAWEPGRFGSILSIALFFNLIIYKFRIRGNSHFWYFTLAILSTQSTTAYLGYLVTLIIYLYNKNREYLIKMFPIILCCIVLLMSLDFMTEKMNNLSVFNEEHNDRWTEAMKYYATKDGFIVPQRFDGLLYEGLNILHDPILGNATDQYSYLYGLFNIKFSLSNGVLRIFANMGIFMGILYYLLCIQSSIWMSRVYKYKGTIWFFIMFILINISYSWIFEPIFLSFIIYPFIVEKQRLFNFKPCIFHSFSRS